MGRTKMYEKVKADGLANVVQLLESRIWNIQGNINSNCNEVNRLAKDTQVLKKERQTLTEMLRDLKPKTKE